MKVDVTQEDIDRGMPKRCSFCPVAKAIQRATGNKYFYVAVSGSELCDSVRAVTRTDYIDAIDLPPEVLVFLTRFDAGKPVEPFSFEFPWTP